MKFLDRLGTMIRADAHGVMDQLEERSLLVKQHLREAELELGRKRARLEAIDEEARRLEEELRRGEARLGEIDADVELALERGEDELARYAVRRLIPERNALRDRRERIAELEEARGRLAERLREQEGVFEDLRARSRARLAELERDERDAGETPAPIADEEIELELLRRRRAAAAAEAV